VVISAINQNKHRSYHDKKALIWAKTNKNATQRIRLDCESATSHNLNRLLYKPGQ